MAKPEAKNELVVNDLSNIDNLLAKVNKMEVTDIELSANYYEFAIGETLRIIPTSVGKMKKMGREDEETDTIRFINAEDGLNYITAAAVLVSTLKEFAEKTAKNEGVFPMEITCIGEKQSAKGKYQTFSVKKLH